MPEQLFECSLKDLQLSSRTKAIASLNYFFVRSSGARVHEGWVDREAGAFGYAWSSRAGSDFQAGTELYFDTTATNQSGLTPRWFAIPLRCLVR